jgi:septum formation topological specificity factor MinE
MSLLTFFRNKMGLQPLTNKVAKDRLANMVRQQRLGVHNEKLISDVTVVVAQYLKIQADKRPYVSCKHLRISASHPYLTLLILFSSQMIMMKWSFTSPLQWSNQEQYEEQENILSISMFSIIVERAWKSNIAWSVSSSNN